MGHGFDLHLLFDCLMPDPPFNGYGGPWIDSAAAAIARPSRLNITIKRPTPYRVCVPSSNLAFLSRINRVAMTPQTQLQCSIT